MNRQLQLVVCAASPARHIPTLIAGLQRRGWQVQVLATAEGNGWLDHPQLAELTGRPVVVTLADQEGHDLARPDLVIVAPATFNTVNHLAAGLAHTRALMVVHEAIGARIPVVVHPHWNSSLGAHPAVRDNIAVLQRFGVTVVGAGSVCEGGCRDGQHWGAVWNVVDIATASPSP